MQRRGKNVSDSFFPPSSLSFLVRPVAKRCDRGHTKVVPFGSRIRQLYTHCSPGQKDKKYFWQNFPLYYILAAFLLAAVFTLSNATSRRLASPFRDCKAQPVSILRSFFPLPSPPPKRKIFFWAKGGEGRRGIEGETSPSISAPCFIRLLHRGERRESGLTSEKKTGVARQGKMLDDLFHLSNIFPRRASFWIQGSETQSFWAAAWARGVKGSDKPPPSRNATLGACSRSLGGVRVWGLGQVGGQVPREGGVK